MIRYPLVLVVVLLGIPRTADAQPPGGPAKELVVSNALKYTVEIKVLRPSGDGFVLVSETVKPGKAFHGSLVSIAGDRIVIAAKTGSPLSVLDTAHFNAKSSTWPTVAFALIEEDGQPRLVRLLMGAAGVKAADPKQQKLFEANKEKVMEGLPKEGASPPAKEKE